LIDTLRLLLLKKGLTSLYAGLEADTLSTFLSNFLYFGLYSLLRRIALKRHGGKALNGPEEILVGLVAGIVSKGLTLPVSTVCVRQQMDEDNEQGQKRKRGIREVVKEVMDERGILGFWAGSYLFVDVNLTGRAFTICTTGFDAVSDHVLQHSTDTAATTRTEESASTCVCYICVRGRCRCSW
jgi:hypothetical protein